MIRKFTPGLLLAGLLVLSAGGQAAEIIYLDETVISGNQELPKVLYVLPWQTTLNKAMPETNRELDISQLMTPIYPFQYRREIAYRNLLMELATTNPNLLENRKKSEED